MSCSKILLLLVAACSLAPAQQTAFRSGKRASPVARAQSKAKAGAVRSAVSYPNQLHVLPQVLDGAGWRTSFIFTNLEDHPIAVSCEFIGADGYLKELEFTFGKGDTTTTDLGVNGTNAFRTAGTAETLSTSWGYCWAGDESTARFGALTVLRFQNEEIARETAIPIGPDEEPKFTVPYLLSETSPMGLLLINTSVEDLAIFKVTLLDYDGAPVEGAVVHLKLEGGQMVLAPVSALFEGKQTRLSVGSLQVEKVEGTNYVTGMGMRIGAGGVVPIQSMSAGTFPVQ